MDGAWDGTSRDPPFVADLERALRDGAEHWMSLPRWDPSMVNGTVGMLPYGKGPVNARIPSRLPCTYANQWDLDPRCFEGSNASTSSRDELRFAAEAVKGMERTNPMTIGTEKCGARHEFSASTYHEDCEEEQATGETTRQEQEADADPYAILETIQDPLERKTVKRLIRNRLSAKRARDRSKSRLTELEHENHKLAKQNSELARIIAILRAKLNAVQSTFHTKGHSCGCVRGSH